MNNEDEAVALGQKLLGVMNSFDREGSSKVLETVLSGHRTLVQQFFDRMVLEVIRRVASDEYAVDGRNLASKEVAVKLMKLMKVLKDENLDISHLPFI